jgi:hypothetical protein
MAAERAGERDLANLVAGMEHMDETAAPAKSGVRRGPMRRDRVGYCNREGAMAHASARDA